MRLLPLAICDRITHSLKYVLSKMFLPLNQYFSQRNTSELKLSQTLTPLTKPIFTTMLYGLLYLHLSDEEKHQYTRFCFTSLGAGKTHLRWVKQGKLLFPHCLLVTLLYLWGRAGDNVTGVAKTIETLLPGATSTGWRGHCAWTYGGSLWPLASSFCVLNWSELALTRILLPLWFYFPAHRQ